MALKDDREVFCLFVCFCKVKVDSCAPEREKLLSKGIALSILYKSLVRKNKVHLRKGDDKIISWHRKDKIPVRVWQKNYAKEREDGVPEWGSLVFVLVLLASQWSCQKSLSSQDRTGHSPTIRGAHCSLSNAYWSSFRPQKVSLWLACGRDTGDQVRDGIYIQTSMNKKCTSHLPSLARWGQWEVTQTSHPFPCDPLGPNTQVSKVGYLEILGDDTQSLTFIGLPSSTWKHYSFWTYLSSFITNSFFKMHLSEVHFDIP